MTAVVFGANGQDGYYLMELLQARGIQTVGISRTGNFLHIDLTDYEAVKTLIDRIRPQFIFHLAANSTTRHEAWKENHDTISSGSLNILEACHSVCPNCKVFLSGSGLQFRNRGLPIVESDPFDATSIYSVSRIHTTYAARYYKRLGLQVYVGYFFNHDSPRRTEKHVARKVTEAVKRISNGSREILEIGNMDVKKEWGFAGDIVKGIWTLVNQTEISEAIIGTGEAYSIRDWIELCFKERNLEWQKFVKEIPGFKPEYSVLVSNPSKINSLGWHHETSLEQLCKMMSQ